MANTSYTLTGDLGDLLGGDLPTQGLTASVITNLRGKALADRSTGGQVRLGDGPLSLDTAGKFTVTLIGTDSTELNVPPGELRYQVVVERGRGRGGWLSGEFELTADADLKDKVGIESPALTSTLAQRAETAATEAEASATEAEAAAASAAGAVVDLDARVTTLEETPPVTSYNDLTDKPTIPATAADVGALPATATPADIGALSAAEPVPEGNLPARLSEEGLTATYAARAKVVVGAGGDYATLTDALAAYPTGNVDIMLKAGTHTIATGLNPSGVKNVRIAGLGRGVSEVQTPEHFIGATADSDQWTVEDLTITCTAASGNTHDGISVDYPRRWDVSNCRLTGFGGGSVRYRGGLHAKVEFNEIVGGNAATGKGIWVERSAASVVATTIVTRGNYIAGGCQYGLLFDKVVLAVSDADIAEMCDVGMRFDSSTGEVRIPYTEANTTAGVQMHDSLMLVTAPREVPAYTWSGIASADRRPLLANRNYINAGKGVMYPGTSAGSDPNTTVSDRSGSGSPEGVITAVVGSTYRRTDGSGSFYVKATGTGNTGWVPLANTPSQLWIGAAEHYAANGTPTLATPGSSTSRVAPPAWLMDAAARESVYASAMIPEGWATYDVHVYWTNVGAGSGNVLWRTDRGALAVGSALPTRSSSSDFTATAAAQDVVSKSAVWSGVPAPAVGTPITIGITRLGDLAGDTLPNDAAFLGLQLVRAT